MTSNIFCSNYLNLQEEEKIESISIFDTQSLIAESEEQDNYTSYGFYNNDFGYDNLDYITKEHYPIENDLKTSKINEENLVSNKEEITPPTSQKNIFLGKKTLLNEDDKIIFKKNRNNLNKNIFKTLNDKNDQNSSLNDNNNINNLTNETSSNNSNNNNKISFSNMRCDSLLIKFKSFLGKSFIKYINDKLKKSTKRRIKFFSFNYKKFTLNVSYSENQKWLNVKIKDLLVLGNEPNQLKNEKALKSIYRRKEEEFNEIKNLLELSYKDIIQRFYRSSLFEDFKKQQKIMQLNDNFKNVMNNSILEVDGFIHFICSRKGNKGKQEDDDINSM
jgi:hypothetical protein